MSTVYFHKASEVTKPSTPEQGPPNRTLPALAKPGELRARSGRAEIEAVQLAKLGRLLQTIVPANSFYARKFSALEHPDTISSLEDFRSRFPLLTKNELSQDQEENPPYGTNLTFPLGEYTRCHQTSGSSGKPLRWLDTKASWLGLLEIWKRVYEAAGVSRNDRLFFAFSFGPFIGFWTAFEAAGQLGCFCFTAGAMTSEARLRAIADNGCTVLLSTPTYALHLGQEAEDLGVELARTRVRLIITAGEPGGSVPGVRARLAAYWPRARVFDHHGMTESGPMSYECPSSPGTLHPVENSFLIEIIDPQTELPSPEGQTGELVVTTLERVGSPLVRYRTGDLVRFAPAGPCVCGTHETSLVGGVLGRADDMVIVRGVNIYPAAVDNIIRGFKGVAEYRVRLSECDELAEISIDLEPMPDVAHPEELAQRLRCAFHGALGLRIPIRISPPGSLPRFEMKSKRWVAG
jgi:phenylacetate-CoA ligase